MKSIVKAPNTVLHVRASEVQVEDISSKKIQRVIQEMKDVLRKTSDGIGIAAPQIGYSLRIFLASEEALCWKKTDDSIHNADSHKEKEIGEKKKEWEYYVFINPVIKKISQKKIFEVEGCLSVSGTYGRVSRAEKITVEAYNEKGLKFTRGTSGLYAKVMQHEIDHLNGILFIEKARNLKHIQANKNVER